MKLKAETIINESDIDDVRKSIYTKIISNIHKSLGKRSRWIIDLFIDHNTSISILNPSTGTTYIKLLKELDYLRKRLLYIQSIDDNECFK